MSCEDKINFNANNFSISTDKDIEHIFDSFEMFLENLGFTPRDIQNQYDIRAYEDDLR